MAIDNTALVTKLGKIFGALNELNTYRGTTLTNREATLRTEYGTDPDDLLNDLAANVTATQKSLDTWVSALSALVSTTIQATVEDDRAIPNLSLDTALAEWVRQLKNGAQTFNDCPVTLTLATATGAPAPTADYTFHTSTKGTDGKPSDFGIPDRYLITVSADGDSGGTRWAETLAVVSKGADDAVTDAAYPSGTGTDTTFQVIDPDTTGGVVTDGTFSQYVADAFTYWTRFGGNTATHVLQAADGLRNGASGFSMKIVSDGTVLNGAKQTVNLSASTVYSLHFAVKGVNVTADPNALVYISVRDATTGAIIVDDSGALLQVASSNLTTIGTAAWTHFVVDFATPYRMPSGGVYLDIRLTGAASNTTIAASGAACEVDHVSFNAMPALYSRGVRLIVYSGAVQPANTDQWELTVALTSGTIGGYIIRWLDRTIGLASRTLKLPTVSGGTETLPDSLIV